MESGSKTLLVVRGHSKRKVCFLDLVDLQTNVQSSLLFQVGIVNEDAVCDIRFSSGGGSSFSAFKEYISSGQSSQSSPNSDYIVSIRRSINCGNRIGCS